MMDLPWKASVSEGFQVSSRIGSIKEDYEVGKVLGHSLGNSIRFDLMSDQLIG
jgi:hypothetical protein